LSVARYPGIVADQESGGPYLDAIRRAFVFAHEHGRRGCGPAEFLVGISETSGSAAAALRPATGRSLREVAVAAGFPAGSAGYLHMQAQEAARSLAGSRGQPVGAGHLLIALLDQGTPEVADLLSRAGLDPAAVRRSALAAIGAPVDLPPIPLPALTPAGTLDRPALRVADLDSRAWTVLRWRQDHLPLSRLHRPGDLQALSHLERAAAWRLASRLDLDDDQRYSLISHHADQVAELAARARPDLAPRIPSSRTRRGPTTTAPRRLRRPHRRLPLLNVTVGWATWFGNRGASLRDHWFHLRTIRHYRRCPNPAPAPPG
jgi:hypothetical protein